MCDAASLNEEIQNITETFKQDIYKKVNSGKSLHQKGRKDCKRPVLVATL
jgi:hypothetical protein